MKDINSLHIIFAEMLQRSCAGREDIMIEGEGEYIKEKTVSKDGRWSSVGSTSPVP